MAEFTVPGIVANLQLVRHLLLHFGCARGVRKHCAPPETEKRRCANGGFEAIHVTPWSTIAVGHRRKPEIAPKASG